MKTRVQKWGNSLALRIPKAFALEVGLQEDREVELSVQRGRLVVVPSAVPSYTLEELLAEVEQLAGGDVRSLPSVPRSCKTTSCRWGSEPPFLSPKRCDKRNNRAQSTWVCVDGPAPSSSARWVRSF